MAFCLSFGCAAGKIYLTVFLFKVLLLTNFKHNPEEEDCPVPEEVRDTLAEFHIELLHHCGKDFTTDVITLMY